MPLLHAGAIKTSPIPQTMQADVPATASFIWENAKQSDGTPYSITDLIEDITKPLESAIVSGSKNFGVMGNNDAIEKFIDKLKDPSVLATEKKRWIDKWEEAFQFNPTIDISEKITTMIKNGLGTMKGPGWLAQAFAATDSATLLTNLIEGGVDKFFNGLKASMPKFIDVDQLKTEMNKQVSDDIKKFHLVSTDPGLDGTNQLVTDSINTLATRFKNAGYKTTTANRPYRMFTQATAKAEIVDEFKTKFHTQTISDEIVTAAFNKAVSGASTTNKAGDTIDNLKNILGAASGIIDSRFIEALKQIKSLGLKETPVEIFEKLLGKTTGDEFINWYNQWNWLIQISHSEKTLSGGTEERISMDLKLRDGIEVIPEEGSGKYPNVKTKFANTPLTGTYTTNNLKVSSVSYITQLFHDQYVSIAVDAATATINEDDLSPLFGASPKDGDVVKDVTPDQLSTLDPNGFPDLQKTIDAEIAQVKNNLAGLYKGFSYDKTKVHVSFKITFHDDGTKRTISIEPTITDGNVENLPGITWGASSATDPKTQKQIDDIFTAINKAHEKLSPSDFPDLVQNVVSPIDSATNALYEIFGRHTAFDGDLPFAMDVIGDLKAGDVIKLSDFESAFKDLKAALDKFDSDNKNRYTVEYKIKELSTKKAVIEYTVTDTVTKETRTKTLTDDELDNIHIDFNESLDKAQALLDKLQKSKIDKSDFDTKQAVEDFGKRTPLKLTQDEFDKMFSEYADLVKEGTDEDVTLSTGDVETVADKDGNNVYFLHFKASFTSAKGKLIEHDIKIQITHDFLSQEEIDKANAQVDKDATDAHETIDKSVLPQDDKDKYNQQITDEREKLKQQIKDEGQDMSEEKLKGILGESEATKTMATAAAMKAKYDEVHGMLEKQFPGGNIPPEVEELFKEKWRAFEDIIKNDPSVLHDIARLKELLKSFSVDSLMNAQKSMQLSGKIALLSLGGLLGIGAGIGGANAIKVATTNKKAVNAKTGKIKSSKKLAVLSAFIGLASLAGSIGTMLYLFLVQGGL